MSNETKENVLVETTKAVVSDVYKDAFQPALKAAGSIVALPLQIVDAALSGPKLWVAEKQYNYERTKELLAEKLKDTPPEKIVPPDNYVAIPALRQISYCFDSDELREMYANLLASSMQTDKKWSVHPSYVDIIKQLCPDEAKILQYIMAHNPDEIPIVNLAYENDNRESISVVKNFSNLGELAECDCPLNICKYFDNLIRLGLVEHGPFISQVAGDHFYTPLENHEFVQEKARKAASRNDGFNKVTIDKLYVYMTTYGKSFCEVCLSLDDNTTVIIE